MNNATIIKEYDLKEITDLAKNYKHVMIEDINGKKITVWNTAKKPLNVHFKECVERLNSKITPDGYYYFCFSQATRFNKDSSTKYLYRKGTPPAPLQQPQNEMQTNKNDLLSVTSALAYITQIAELKVSLETTKMQLKQAQDENVVLTAELEEYEREEGLSENKGSPITEYLKETAPSLMALADRFFEHQDKKLNLEQQKINLGIYTTQTPEKKQIKREVKTFTSGSPEHLQYIRLLHSQNKEELLNTELDKLEINHPAEYQEICKELDLLADENNNEE